MLQAYNCKDTKKTRKCIMQHVLMRALAHGHRTCGELNETILTRGRSVYKHSRKKLLHTGNCVLFQKCDSLERD